MAVDDANVGGLKNSFPGFCLAPEGGMRGSVGDRKAKGQTAGLLVEALPGRRKTASWVAVSCECR